MQTSLHMGVLFKLKTGDAIYNRKLVMIFTQYIER